MPAKKTPKDPSKWADHFVRYPAGSRQSAASLKVDLVLCGGIDSHSDRYWTHFNPIGGMMEALGHALQNEVSLRFAALSGYRI
jgi:hypothetical protein